MSVYLETPPYLQKTWLKLFTKAAERFCLAAILSELPSLPRKQEGKDGHWPWVKKKTIEDRSFTSFFQLPTGFLLVQTHSLMIKGSGSSGILCGYFEKVSFAPRSQASTVN